MKRIIFPAFLVLVTFAITYFTLNRSQEAKIVAAPTPVVNNALPECLANYDFTIEPVNIDDAKKILPDAEGLYNLAVKVINNTDAAVTSAEAKGGTNASYRWFSKSDNKMILEGHRGLFEQPLKPKQTAEANLKIRFPIEKGDYILRLTLVQEMCAWFDDKNLKASYDINYSVR